jgi:DNA-binding CsgD family transcriptional regulator
MSIRRGPELTDRELRTLDLMSRGQSNPQIAKTLYMSEDAIKSRVRSIFDKVGARDRAHAVRRGFELGLLSVDEVPAGIAGVEPETLRRVAQALLVSAHRVEVARDAS